MNKSIKEIVENNVGEKDNYCNRKTYKKIIMETLKDKEQYVIFTIGDKYSTAHIFFDMSFLN